MLDVLANASRPRNKLRPRSPFSDEKNAGNRTSPGWMVWNSALCTCAHTHACRKNRACAFLAGFRVVCCLFYRFPVRNALRASQAVHATDVMVNYFLPRQLRHQLWVRSFPLSILNPNCFSISSRVIAVFPHKGHVCCSVGILREGSCRLISLSISGVRS